MRQSVCAALILLALGCFASCGRGSGVQSYLEEPFPKRLSDWQLFVKGATPLVPNQRVVPYDLNTPLFSDYASKYRFVWMPEGTAATYHEEEAFAFPVGAILSKTFAYPATDSSSGERLIETRLLVNTESGWVSLPYVWNAEQTDAILQIAGSTAHIGMTDASGQVQTIRYNIPNTNECAQCHDLSKTLLPVGTKARQLNRDFAYPDGTANQLDYWTKIGYLTGAPPSSAAPKLAVWNDSQSASMEARARAYLDGNCAHCHRANGSAGYTAFLLDWKETDPRRLGYCKSPNSAGFSGNLAFDVVPGKPDESILIYRMQSTRAKEMMPEIGRSTIHQEGLALIREWVASLKGKCE